MKLSLTFSILFCVVFLTSVSLFSQKSQNSFEKEWKQYEAFKNQDKPRSAADVAKSIYEQAKKNKEYPMMLKALFVLSSDKISYEEDDSVNLVQVFEDEIASAPEPSRSVLSSVYANLLWNYVQANRWSIQRRTKRTTSNSNDITTMSLDELLDKITYLYDNSIRSKSILVNTPLKEYEILLNEYSDSDKYRVHLYDLLVHRAVRFYVSGLRNSMEMPGEAFSINTLDGLLPTNEFSTKKITTKDTASLHYKALIALQELERVHSLKSLSLGDAILLRLELVLGLTTHSEKNVQYFNTLSLMTREFQGTEIEVDVQAALANYFYTMYPKDALLPNGNNAEQEALRITKVGKALLPNSRGGQRCAAIESMILQPMVNSNEMDYIYPNEPFLQSISYKNIEKVTIRVFPIDLKTSLYFPFTYDTKKNLLEDILKSKTEVINRVVSLPPTTDLRQATIEIPFDGLPKGNYLFVINSTEDEGIREKDYYAISLIHSSELSVIHSTSSMVNLNEYLVYNKKKGTVVKDAEVRFYQHNYDYKTYQFSLKFLSKEKTGIRGEFTYATPSNDYRNGETKAWIIKENDTVLLPVYSPYYYPQNENETNITNLYTDRAIYRPGQTIYYKGIAVNRSRDGLQYTVVQNKKMSINFYDVNHTLIEKREVTTNEFGSFHGSFTAPSSGLLGMMTLQTQNGSIAIRVEEYKRPKFEISFPTIDSSFRFLETVQVKGIATSYTGAAIDNAVVKYKVKRQVYFPYWRWWCYWSIPSYSNDVYIAEGTTNTTIDGKFTIPFVAYPDNMVSDVYKPVCRYIVEVDVTDNVGETRSKTTYITVSNYALQLSTNISIEAFLNKATPLSVLISSSNANGGFEPAKGTYEIAKIPESTFPKIKRLFSDPTKFLIAKTEFDAKFPYYEYTNNLNYPMDSLPWGSNENIFENRTESSSIQLPISNLSTGRYAIKIKAKDKYGNEIIEFSTFTLYDTTSQKNIRTSFLDIVSLKTTCKPGENARFLLSSSEVDVPVYMQIEKNKTIIKRQIIKLSQSQEIIEIPVTDKDFGGFYVHFQSISQGKATIHAKQISVPYFTKPLKIVTKTYRDKTKPGSNEEWEFSVSDFDNKPVNAEVLASMYDKSLDQFAPSFWSGLDNIFKYNYSTISTSQMLFPSLASHYNFGEGFYSKLRYFSATEYSDLNLYNLYLYQNRYGYGYGRKYKNGMNRTAGSLQEEDALSPAPSSKAVMINSEAASADREESPGKESKKDAPTEQEITQNEPKKEITIRKNLNETAFFYPDLRTDSLGRFKVVFTIPEALTTWKFRTLAHTQSVQSGITTNETITQKELMVQPAIPRFLRHGDTVEIPMKIINLTDSVQSGVASLQLVDPTTEKDVAAQFAMEALSKKFTIPAKQSVSVSFLLKVNDIFSALQITGIADGGLFTDAEQSVVPVLSNRMLVTETMPLPLKAKQERTFTFADMKRGFSSTTMKPHRYTLEVTSNPIWYAIQSLPYLMEYPHECAEQLFSRFYANSIGLKIVNDNPEIEKVFDVWKKLQPTAFQSNLQKNQELKNVLLEETPWLNEGNDEQERKKRVALFFDRNTMNQSLSSALRKLREMQLGSGAFTWFPGMRENRWITQHILAGLGKLRNLGIKNVPYDMYQPATRYIVAQIEDDYNSLVRSKTNLNQDNLGYETLHAMYAVSFFDDVEFIKGKGFEYFLDQTKKYWRKKDFYTKGISALILHRFNEKKEALLCFESLKEFSTVNDEMGRYFKDNRAGWYWYQAPIENQALMIEVFNDVGRDSNAVEQLKTWLLKQKQTTDWKTTKATTEAVYALLGFGVRYINEKGIVAATVGEKPINPLKEANDPVEAGTGYYKVTWNGAGEIKESMAEVTLSNPNNVVAWGALYWQYFEDMSKIKSSETNLRLKKQLFIESMNGAKKVLTPVTSVSPIKIGDKIIARIELKTDRNLEYVHLKDMRGSGFEPVNVLSQYKWQDGFGYYESTKDVATHFFIDYLAKGSYVFEYPLRATTRGGFDNGIATIQCMYAPEFSSHSEGIRVQIK